MRSFLNIILVFVFMNSMSAQSPIDKELIRTACMDYLEGFYEGDTTKIIRSIKPRLHKLGFGKDSKTGVYESKGYMTFEKAKNYSKRVFEEKKFPSHDAPKKVEILDVMSHIASAKITAWWGNDYILLSKDNDKWMIEQVLWQGPLEEQE